MNIGIYTYHFGHNYGAMLQAYAIQQALEDMGHCAKHVHVRADFTLISKYERIPSKGLKGKATGLIFRLLRKHLRNRFKNFESFLRKNIKITKRYKSNNELKNDPPEFDAYICGSDQIWNLENGIEELFFGSYAPDDKLLISYAPSFGKTEIPPKYLTQVVTYLKRFDSLSVREECGRDLVSEVTGRKVSKVIDPVFLIGNEIWENLETAPSMKKPYIAFYSLESSKRTSRIVSSLSKEYGLPVVILGKPGGFMITCKTKLAIDAGPSEFLGWLRHAALIITNSFHATAFAVKFDKPFVTIAHSRRNSRMENLLGSLGLEDRIVHQPEDLKDRQDGWAMRKLPADVDKKTADQVTESLAYLRNALSSAS